MFKTLSLAAAFIGCTAILSAQAVIADADTYKVNYYTNSSTCAYHPNNRPWNYRS